MKLSAQILLVFSMLIVGSAQADNVIRSQAPIAEGNPWQAEDPVLGTWVNSGSPTGCTLSPLASSIETGVSFTQRASGCTQTQTRTVTQIEKNRKTGETRITGQKTITQQLTDYAYSMTAYGTGPFVPSCQAYSSTDSWIEYRQSSGMVHGFSVTSNGKVVYNNYSSSGSSIYSSITDSQYRYTRSAAAGSGTYSGNKAISTYFYGVCKTKK